MTEHSAAGLTPRHMRVSSFQLALSRLMQPEIGTAQSCHRRSGECNISFWPTCTPQRAKELPCEARLFLVAVYGFAGNPFVPAEHSAEQGVFENCAFWQRELEVGFG